MLPHNVHDLVHAGHLATHVHQHDSFCFWCYGLAYAFRTEAETFINFGKYGKAATEEHRLYAGDVGKRRHNHFVTCAKACSSQCTGSSRGTGRYCVRIFGTGQFFYFAFKIAGFPMVVALRVMVTAEENGRVEHILDFLFLLGAE